MKLADIWEDYLESSAYIDWENEEIQRKAEQLRQVSKDKLDYVKSAYEFVRDEIGHSWDVQDKRITISASSVLHEKVGICWAKSNLLAALLRAEGIPAGICCQRLTFGDTPQSGYCIHALNAVYIERMDKWIRLDARGNKEGVNAQFSLEKEQLAFPVRAMYDEKDYDTIYAKPVDITIEVLKRNTDALYMCLYDLPQEIEE